MTRRWQTGGSQSPSRDGPAKGTALLGVTPTRAFAAALIVPGLVMMKVSAPA